MRRTLNYTWLTLMTLVIVPFVGGARECEEPDAGDCVCTAEYAPVCGVDGETYGNACQAACAESEVAHAGECDGGGPELCMVDEECGAGEACHHDECLSGCDDGEACPAVCYGQCGSAPEPELCLDDASCGLGQRCDHGECLSGCGEGEVCAAVCYGQCVAGGPEHCTSDADCPAGHECFSERAQVCDPDGCDELPPSYGQCIERHDPPPPGCFSDSECAGGERCALPDQLPEPRPAGRCVPDDEPELCLADADCRDDGVCDHSECLSACSGDESCIAVCYGSCQPRYCPLYACAPESVTCEYGQRRDANGCATCECEPAPECGGGAICAIYCEFGHVPDENGCDTCECQPAPTCGSDCQIACEYGRVLDASGCETCECLPPPSCQPVACLIACEHGFATDETGCEVCECAPAP